MYADHGTLMARAPKTRVTTLMARIISQGKCSHVWQGSPFPATWVQPTSCDSECAATSATTAAAFAAAVAGSVGAFFRWDCPPPAAVWLLPASQLQGFPWRGGMGCCGWLVAAFLASCRRAAVDDNNVALKGKKPSQR